MTDTEGLLWLANQNSIHVWPSRAPNLYQPDICVFDLDPSKADDLDALRVAALSVRSTCGTRFTELDQDFGAKGFHIAVPLDGKSDFGTVARFAHVIGQILVKRDPDNLTQEFAKVDRGGRILVDTGRNGYSATFAAAIRCARSRARLFLLLVRGKNWNAVRLDQRVYAADDGPTNLLAWRLWADMLKIKKSLIRPIARLRKLQESPNPRFPHARLSGSISTLSICIIFPFES